MRNHQVPTPTVIDQRILICDFPKQIRGIILYRAFWNKHIDSHEICSDRSNILWNLKHFLQTKMHSIKWYFSIKHLKLQHTENEIIQKKVKDIILSILALTFNVSQLSGYTSKTFSKFESALLKSPNLICTCPKPGNRIKKLKQWNRQIIPSLWKCHWDAINIILMQKL
jgi:hypothetical protein